MWSMVFWKEKKEGNQQNLGSTAMNFGSDVKHIIKPSSCDNGLYLSEFVPLSLTFVTGNVY